MNDEREGRLQILEDAIVRRRELALLALGEGNVDAIVNANTHRGRDFARAG